MNAAAPIVVLFIVAGKLLLHLVTRGLYGFHRDEIYLLICGRHLSWGGPDHAPMAPAVARVAEVLFGGSAAGLRVVAALLSTATVAMTARLARRLGGDWTATGIAAVAGIMAPVFLFYGGVYCTGTLEALGWIASCDFLLSALRKDRVRDWLLLGAALGIAFLSKYTAGLCALGLALGLAFSDERRVYFRRGPWLAMLTALGLALPNLIWQAQHDAPALSFFGSTYQALTQRFDRLSVLAAQPVIMHPFTFVIACGGLVTALRSRGLERIFAVLFLVAAIIVIAVPGKPYYLAPAYLPLLAIGSRSVARWLMQRAAMTRVAIGAATLCGLIIAFLLTLPVLPFQLILRMNLHSVSRELLQFAPWRDVAKDIAQAHRAAGGSARLGVLTDSYGTAAAVEHYGAELALPRPLCGANSYFIWGAPASYDQLLIIGYPEPVLDALCGTHRPIGTVRSPFSVGNRYDFPRTIWLCAKLARQPAEVWPQLRRYD